MDTEYQQFQLPATSSFSFQPNGNLLTGAKRAMGYVPYGLLLLLLFILLLLTGIKFGELHKDVQAIKVHMGRMVHEWETYTEDTGLAPPTEDEANNKVVLERITPVQGSCKNDWVFFQSSCYLVHSGTSNWSQAEQQCVSHGGHLLVLNTVEELDYISKIVQIHRSYWIGLADHGNEGQWGWVDGTEMNPTLHVWDVGQPDNWGNKEDCGQIHHSVGRYRKMLNDADCKLNFSYICKVQA
ncbi:C-type lectin domain family 4 member E-like [Nelusetta ayraudi]|uniref:C-type lectin domain family 4 member E-like n=1 Tax=Nelusetta ayraudi TaxID=303726 RepID=UPI003F6EEB8D